MGCTSSAPSSVAANANKDKSIQFKEDAAETQPRHDAIDTESEPRTEIKVLPPSDTNVDFAEPVQLIRNIRSTTSLEPEKGLHNNGHIVETKQIDTSEVMKEEHEDKIAKLEEVVGKFIDITHQDTNPDKNAVSNADEATGSIKEENEETVSKMETKSKENDGEDTNNSEETENASPSQSQSSRATRWEALADIAAELPPSLAVDPLTGQIYSLSK